MAEKKDKWKEMQLKDALLSEAKAKSIEIISKANAVHEKEIKLAKLACKQAQPEKIKHNLHRENEREYAEFMQKSKQKLLRHRAEMVQLLFEEIKAKLLSFAKSKDYAAWLEFNFKECASLKKGASQQVTVFIKAKDEVCMKMAQDNFANCKIEIDENILIGGAKIAFDKILFNKTLDNALQEEELSFYETSGLVID